MSRKTSSNLSNSVSDPLSEFRSQKLPRDVQRVLRTKAITEQEHGTILRDAEMLLEAIGEESLASTGKYLLLPQSRLAELNMRMSRPFQHRLQRPQQRSIPHLHGLYMVMRASGLLVGSGSSASRRLMVNREMMEVWHSLNATERYFSLLEAWLIDSSSEIIGEDESYDECGWGSLNRVSSVLRNSYERDSDKELFAGLFGPLKQAVVALMELFGWLELTYDKPKEREVAKLSAVRWLPWGEAMDCVTRRLYWEGVCNPGSRLLAPALQPYFPQWQRSLLQPERTIQEGVYMWHVSLGRVWRRIAAPAELSLDDLAGSILEAFKFDDDHLYCFKFKDSRGKSIQIECPYIKDAPVCTDEFSLGELGLSKGDEMIFHFDFGADWEFAMKLEAIEPRNSRRKRAAVIAKGGRAPKQYENDW